MKIGAGKVNLRLKNKISLKLKKKKIKMKKDSGKNLVGGSKQKGSDGGRDKVCSKSCKNAVICMQVDVTGKEDRLHQATEQ